MHRKAIARFGPIGVAASIAMALASPALAELPIEGPLTRAGTPGAPPLPPGSFSKTCKDINLNAVRLEASCHTSDDVWKRMPLAYKFCREPVTNKEGYMVCNLDTAAELKYQEQYSAERRARSRKAVDDQVQLEKAIREQQLKTEAYACYRQGGPYYIYQTMINIAPAVLGQPLDQNTQLTVEKWFVTGFVKGQWHDWCGKGPISPDRAGAVMKDWLSKDVINGRPQRKAAVWNGFRSVLGRDPKQPEEDKHIGHDYTRVKTDLGYTYKQYDTRDAIIQRAFAFTLARPPKPAELAKWQARPELYDGMVAALKDYLYNSKGPTNPEPGYVEFDQMVSDFTTQLKGGQPPATCVQLTRGRTRAQNLGRAEWNALTLLLPAECLKANPFSLGTGKH